MYDSYTSCRKPPVYAGYSGREVWRPTHFVISRIGEAGRNKWNHRRGVYLCDCGQVFECVDQSVKSGDTTSCGCYKKIVSKTHGHSRIGSLTYSSWKHMKSRTQNLENGRWKDYGGRGIKTCASWLRSFAAFLEDMGERPEGTSIDRINNDGNYEPSNCRWATKEQQHKNQKHSNQYISRR